MNTAQIIVLAIIALIIGISAGLGIGMWWQNSILIPIIEGYIEALKFWENQSDMYKEKLYES